MDITFSPDDDFIPNAGETKTDNPLRSKEKKNGSKTTNKKASSAPTVAQGKKLCANLPDMYRTLAMGVGMYDWECAQRIAENADSLGKSWEKLAETSPGFRKFLDRLNNASGWGAVLSAHVPLAIGVAAHHMPELFESRTNDETAESASDG